MAKLLWMSVLTITCLQLVLAYPTETERDIDDAIKKLNVELDVLEDEQNALLQDDEEGSKHDGGETEVKELKAQDYIEDQGDGESKNNIVETYPFIVETIR